MIFVSNKSLITTGTPGFSDVPTALFKRSVNFKIHIIFSTKKPMEFCKGFLPNSIVSIKWTVLLSVLFSKKLLLLKWNVVLKYYVLYSRSLAYAVFSGAVFTCAQFKKDPKKFGICWFSSKSFTCAENKHDPNQNKHMPNHNKLQKNLAYADFHQSPSLVWKISMIQIKISICQITILVVNLSGES